MSDPLFPVSLKIETLFRELFAHDGFAEFKIEMRLLRRGQKEIVVHCGKQYRYVVDFPLQEAE